MKTKNPALLLWLGSSTAFLPSSTVVHPTTSGSLIKQKNHQPSPRSSTLFSAIPISPGDAHFSGEEESTSAPTTKASSVASATFNLIKAMLGTGVLALPSGLAAISNHRSILFPGNVLLVILGALSAYTFSLYGRLTHHYPQARSLGDLWDTIQKGKSQVPVVSIANLIFCLGCNLTFLLVIGDSLSSLLSISGTTAWWASRQTAILAVTSTLLWPLCNLPSLNALAPVSLLGVVGTLFVTAFMGFRCPSLVANSPYAAALPVFETYHRVQGPAPLILIAMGCVAFMAHFSAPDFYHAVAGTPKDKSATSTPATTSTSNNAQALKKFTLVTLLGFASVALLNAATITFGFLTFGGNAQGIILNNYATQDWGAIVSRLLVVISVIGGFPFLFTAGRGAALDLWPAAPDHKANRERKMTAGLLAGLTALSLVLKDAGFVIGFNGALLGSAIIYIFPALLFLKHTASLPVTRIRSLERWFCRFLVAMGGVSSVIGAGTTVLLTYFPHMLR